jgi:Tetratricopeptide repeat
MIAWWRGPDHPTVARDVNNLGDVLKASGDLPGAKAAFERALAILRKFLGDDHPHTKIVCKNLEALEKRSKKEAGGGALADGP